jgi:hypothetical protein
MTKLNSSCVECGSAAIVGEVDGVGAYCADHIPDAGAVAAVRGSRAFLHLFAVTSYHDADDDRESP